MDSARFPSSHTAARNIPLWRTDGLCATMQRFVSPENLRENRIRLDLVVQCTGAGRLARAFAPGDHPKRTRRSYAGS